MEGLPLPLLAERLPLSSPKKAKIKRSKQLDKRKILLDKVELSADNHKGILDTAVEGSELYCYNTEGDINSAVSQAPCRMDLTRLEQPGFLIPFLK